MTEEFKKMRETLDRLEAQAQREDQRFANTETPQVTMITNPETKYELGQSAYSSGTTITFIKSLKGNDLSKLETDFDTLQKFVNIKNKGDNTTK